MHTVAVLALDQTIAFDLATPIEIFGRATRPDGSAAYDVIVAGPNSSVAAGPLTLGVPHRLDRVESADTIIVPGLADPTVAIDAEVIGSLQRAHDRGARIASICVGAFTLAATGLLDNMRATTHWQAAELLRARHPSVDVDANVLYVDNGSILTSAGATAGIDLCLHLVQKDLGVVAARATSRAAVAPIFRDGGQAQFIDEPLRRDDDWSLRPTVAWMEANLGQRISLADLAARAKLSPRTLTRRFREETGTSPCRYLLRARIHFAQSLLETTSLTVDRIAQDAGFGTAENLRTQFIASLSTSPAAYRRSFRGSRVGEPGS